MNGPALSASELWYAYPGGQPAVRGVSLSLAPGESVGVIGPNGAGKTTLFQLLAGLLRPQKGTVEVLGEPFDTRSRELRRRIGFVFQETEDQLFCPTVFDDVSFGPLQFGLPREEIAPLVSEALENVGLEGYEERSSHHLSSGERRRVAIASVLSYRPEILLLDEPSSDLDPRGRRELIELLNATRRTKLIASHDLELILLTCTQVLLMESGRIGVEGPAVDIICSQETLEKHGLEIPLGLSLLGREGLLELLRREKLLKGEG